ncbi:SIS domain-containing protein [Xylocopilactobacillus apis]|uniref:SIS domain-containing protein n=1 Tax=Xylocopilactobacillus apis TaxID=2932183 RepID=A0AAU9D7L6_9LACO|nr:SIS domain-containing protein [Xylocopilactobacillus apis]BDR57430.1 hypothetical protein KIMC2_19920 [Xylocopilactobacillus apis]
MLEYMEHIKNIMSKVNDQEKDSINRAVDLLTKTTINKKSIYVFGASHAGILAQEMYYRAGGLMNINAIFGREVMLDREPITFTSKMERLEGYGKELAAAEPFTKDDVLILHSVSGRNPVIIDLAISAKKQGVKIISLTNLSYSKSVSSRHSTGKRLFEVSDIVIDNHGDIGDATCNIPNLNQKVGPTSTVVGAAILNSIVVEVCKELIKNGVEYPPIFYSANLDGGDKKNQELYVKYKNTIHYSY